MKNIQITTAERQNTYQITIGEGLREQIAEIIDLTNYSAIAVICDEQIASLFLEDLLTTLPTSTTTIILPSGEKAKTIQTVQTIWQKLKQAHFDRKSLIINLGGGVIGDMGGFAAATYMRGIDFIHVPTTLLAQVDASIGGKTAIDFAGIKNMIGTFTQPKAVIIDTQTLTSLPKRAFLSGFAEMMKHGLIADETYVTALTRKDPLQYSAAELTNLITRSCEIKAQIVATDEKESGERKLLNFGHTIGHAVESLSLETDNPLLHGEAISIGMIAEAYLSQSLGLLPKDDFVRIQQMLEQTGLPLKVSHFTPSIQEILGRMKSDKKNERGQINLTLLTKIGKGVYDQKFPDKAVEEGIAQILS